MRRSFMLALLLSVSACQADTQTESGRPIAHKEQSQAQPVRPPKGVKAVPQAKPFRGTIRYLSLEGGFFGIVTDRGLKILPINLDKQYHQDGAEIEFTGVFAKDIATIQQWGRPFRLTKVEIITPGKPVKPGNTAL